MLACKFSQPCEKGSTNETNSPSEACGSQFAIIYFVSFYMLCAFLVRTEAGCWGFLFEMICDYYFFNFDITAGAVRDSREKVHQITGINLNIVCKMISCCWMLLNLTHWAFFFCGYFIDFPLTNIQTQNQKTMGWDLIFLTHCVTEGGLLLNPLEEGTSPCQE